jgi:hypothetical protein
VQNERAYQKQFGVTGGFKSKEKKAPGKSGHRFYKSVGLGFKTPREAIEGGGESAVHWRPPYRSHGFAPLQAHTSTRNALSSGTYPFVVAFFQVNAFAALLCSFI